MSKKIKYSLIIALILSFLVAILGFTIQPLFTLADKNESDPTIRLAWMNSFAESTIPAVTMKHTGFLKGNNVNVDFVGFQYGPPMVEAAIAGDVDVLFVGIVPAISLLTKSDDWVIIGRLGFFEEVLMVSPDSNIKTIADLRGKKLALPLGTGPHPCVIKLLKENGIDPKKDITIFNIKPPDYGVALETKQVDAVAWGEPLTATLSEKGLAYPLVRFSDISVIIFRKSFVEKYPDQIKLFLKSFKESMFYFSQHKQEVFNWASKETIFNANLINKFKFVEPNYFAVEYEDINLDIPNSWVPIMQEKADFEYQEGYYPKSPNIKEHIDLSFIK